MNGLVGRWVGRCVGGGWVWWVALGDDAASRSLSLAPDEDVCFSVIFCRRCFFCLTWLAGVVSCMLMVDIVICLYLLPLTFFSSSSAVICCRFFLFFILYLGMWAVSQSVSICREHPIARRLSLQLLPFRSYLLLTSLFLFCCF